MQNRNAIESLSSNKSYKNKQLFITFITYILKVQLAIRFNGYKIPQKNIIYCN